MYVLSGLSGYDLAWQMYCAYVRHGSLFEGEILQCPVFGITLSKAGVGLPAKLIGKEGGLSTRNSAARLTIFLG